MNALAPIAAAMAVIVVIAASVALPHLLTGASRNPAAPGISAPAPGHYPPFRVVVTTNHDNRESKLLVESAATGHAVSTLAPPWQGAMWIDVAATADARRFIVAAAPESSPYTPTRLYSLTLSARGTVTRLAPLAVPTLPGEITSLVASADGYTTFGPGAAYQAGVITGGRTRQWSVPAGEVGGMWHVSVSSDGGMLAVIAQSLRGGSVENTAWALRTGSAPGSLTARAKKVYDHSYVGGTRHAMTILESALISPDGGTLYPPLHDRQLGPRQDRDRGDRVQHGGRGIARPDIDLGRRLPDALPGRRHAARLGRGLIHRLPDQPGDPDEDDAAAARTPPRAVPDARLVIQQNHSSRVLPVWP